MGMQAAVAFWNNGYAPDNLRRSFSSLMRSYVRPIMASASDVYRFTGGGESVPIAVIQDNGVMRFFTRQTQAGANSTMQHFKVVELDIQSKLVRDVGVVIWRMDVSSEHIIKWQFVGPRQIFGVSNSESEVYYGEWPEHDDYSIPVHVQQVSVETGEKRLPPAWALVNKEETTYCVSSWYPAIEIGIFKLSSSTAQCEAHASHFNTPRSLSFFGPAISSLIYRGDLWFLLRVEAVDALAVVVLGPDYQLKAYTPPFTLELEMAREGGGVETALDFDVIVSGDGNENVVFAYTSRDDVVIKQLPMETMLTLMM